MSEKKMFFSIGVACKDSWLFVVPHREKPMKVKHIIRKFPKFAAEFDGSAAECCLSWYYKYNKGEGLFEFKDIESEDEVAEMMGVDLCMAQFVDEDSSGSAAKALTAEEIAAVHEHLADIRHGLGVLEGRHGGAAPKEE
jgi:hypothetical protein